MGIYLSAHASLNGLFFLGSIAMFAVGLKGMSTLTEAQCQQIWIAGLVLFFVYPIVAEILFNIKSAICSRSISKANHRCLECQGEKELREYLPIVYSPRYNISFCGLEKVHPFDSQKYGRVFNYLIQKGVIETKVDKVHQPSFPKRELLNELMTKRHLFWLNFSTYICKCIEVPLFFLPEFLMRMRVLEPMQLATQGSIDAACLALKHKWAINLAGGYHHASCG